MAAKLKKAEALQCGDLVLDPQSWTVRHGSREIRLRPVEFRLLHFFMRNAGRVLSRADITSAIWESSYRRPDRKPDVHIARLRLAFARARTHSPIQTIRGQGYTLGSGKNCVVAIPSGISAEGGACIDFQLDHRRQCVRRLRTDIQLAPKLFALLDMLISMPGTVFTREQIAHALWPGKVCEHRSVDVMIRRLRAAINRGVADDPLRAVGGVGYKFSETFREQHTDWPLPRPRRKVRLPIRS